MSRVRGALVLAVATVLIGLGSGLAGADLAQAALKDSALTFQPQLGVPGLNTVIGASPGEAPGEVWATGEIGSVPATVGGSQIRDTKVLLRRSQGTDWEIVPVPSFSGTPRVTYDGGVAMLGAEGEGQTVITRDPGGAFAPASEPPPLLKGERLASGAQQPLLTAIDDLGHTGALLVPAVVSPKAPAVFHYDGTGWAREPLCTEYAPAGTEPCTPARDLTVLAIGASSPENAWLLASYPGRPLVLFRRTGTGSGAVWEQTWTPADGEPVTARRGGQMLTVTASGVWVDARFDKRTDESFLVQAFSPYRVLGTWCYPQECGGGSLGSALPAEYSSFAATGGGPMGTRIISGLPGGGLLRFQGEGNFSYVVGVGGQSLSAQFFGEGLEEGWLSGVSNGADGARLEHVSSSPEPTLDPAQGWPLPFRRPLLAIAPEPGTTPGDPDAQALAVGDQGQIARYAPGVGWTPEFLYNSEGVVQRPRLRGVAWPEPGRAYAVGDEGAMWLWRADTGLWEPDPAAPLGLHANLTAIAFSPLNPAVGYAVGKQGALLAYDKTWTQAELPSELEHPTGIEAGCAQPPPNFTSVAFAGAQALVAYRQVRTNCKGEFEGEVGGLIENDGSGWRIDPSAERLLAQLNDPTATVLSRVAGLPDGGAVAAGPGIVIERDSATSEWHFSHQPLTEAQNISALAAIRAGSEVRALVSVDLAPTSNPNGSSEIFQKLDSLPSPAPGEPPSLVGPDPLPATGYLLLETAEGWKDLEQQAYPQPSSQSLVRTDLPAWPDAVLALDVNPSGSAGWGVGGQTGGQFLEGSGGNEIQSSLAMRLGAGAPPSQSSAPVAIPNKQATFAVGGNAQCEGPCASLLNEGLAPDVWLSSAVSSAARIPGLRGFLYTGARVAEGAAGELSGEEFTRELSAYREDLEGAGSLPVHAAVSPSDLERAGTPSAFDSALCAYAGVSCVPGVTPMPSVPAGTRAPPAGTDAYAFDSAGAGGTVRVIVLDYSHPESGLGGSQLEWLAAQLASARSAGVPAIVMGNTDVIKSDGVHAADAALVERVLLEYGASAYIFDTPGENREEKIGSGSDSIPAFGTGTLGYVPSDLNHPEEFLGASGSLLVSVNAERVDRRTNRAPVTATLTPSIAQLALDATDGTLLRRSQAALFEGLARRPVAGYASVERQVAPDPYVPIPETCVGSGCGAFIAPEYTFHSSKEDIGDFVEPELASGNPRAVRQGPNGLPIHDEHSGLFCAYNAGTTIVSITTGGLTYSEQVTVQAGSVEQPCGTVPLKNPPALAASAASPLGALPPSTPPASSPTPLVAPPPPLAPPAPVVAPPPPPRAPVPPPPPPFLASPPPLAALIAIPLLPPPAVARPIPPSGTSAVTEPAVKAEEEDEEAVESARNNMAAYDPRDPILPPVSLIALIVIAAGAGAGIRRSRRDRRTRGTPAFARSGVRRREGPW